MARQANWTCLEEDDCQMIEWVRDEMSIRWSSELAHGHDQWQPICSSIEGAKRPRRSRTSSNGSVRVKTPTLSPYASRTNSLHGKKRESQLLSHRRTSTLDRLKEASETLLEHGAESGSKEDLLTTKDAKQPTDRKSSKVSIVAVEPVSPQRPGIKTSFGGFSSLNVSRSHSLALAEETEDHLGIALSIPSTGGASSPKERQGHRGLQAFGEGITAADILGAEGGLSPSKPSPPEPRKLSRFSIKSYQLERNKTDDWGLGSLDTTLNPPMSGKSEISTTPPLVADVSVSGTVSPLSPVSRQSQEQVHDFLSGSTPPKSNVNRPQQFGMSLFGTASDDQQPRTMSESSNGVDNSNSTDDSTSSSSSSRRSFGVYSPRKSFSSNSSSSNSSNNSNPAPTYTNNSISPLDAPVELIPDFLGASLPSAKATSISTRQGAVVPGVAAAGTTLNRVLSSSSTSAIKAVHFSDSATEDRLQRVESDPCTVRLSSSLATDPILLGEDNTDMLVTEDAGVRRPMSSSRSSSISSSSSKSKAHTRRSWGQGIGGNDIQGIQGLE
jgi:hypothetical protein